jgi:hypothetical protein
MVKEGTVCDVMLTIASAQHSPHHIPAPRAVVDILIAILWREHIGCRAAGQQGSSTHATVHKVTVPVHLQHLLEAVLAQLIMMPHLACDC